MTCVMLDGRYLSAKPSGVGRYCTAVVSAMQRERQSLDWRFVVRRPGDEGALRSSGTVRFDAQPYGPATSLVLPWRLGRQPADLFHSPFHVLPVGLRCPAVVTMHDVFQFRQLETSNYPFPISWMEWGYFLWAIPESLRRATRVVCVSHSTADELIARLPWVADKVRVIHHGVGTRFRPLADRDAVAQTCRRLVGDKPFFLSIGGLSPNKNHERMLQAFARAFPDPSGPMLVTVSRFGKQRRLQQRARAWGVDDRWVSLRAPSDDQVLALYNGALALAFCSVVEGFGLPVLEAMACGCPVLTSNISCLPEVAGSAAQLADPHDVDDMAKQLRRLAQEPALRRELRARGLERAAQFTWERAAKLHLEVYDEALQG